MNLFLKYAVVITTLIVWSGAAWHLFMPDSLHWLNEFQSGRLSDISIATAVIFSVFFDEIVIGLRWQ